MNIGEVGYLKTKTVKRFGAFLEWQEEQDILLPEEEQIVDIRIDREYLVIICYDKKADKYFASQKIDQHLIDVVLNEELKKGQQVEITVYATTPLGVKASIDNKYRGMLYKNELFQDVKFGDKLTAYIKEIREDGKIDIALQLQTYKQVPSTTGIVLDELKQSDGFLPFNDKSSPESIRAKFNISKKVFKQTIGALYKQRKITISESGIRLI